MSCGISIAITSSRGGTQVFLHTAHQLIILPRIIIVVEGRGGGVLLILGVHNRGKASGDISNTCKSK